MRCARGFKLAPLRRLAGPAPRAPSAPALRPAGPAGGHGPGDPPACRPIRARPRPRSESPPDARGGVGGGGGVARSVTVFTLWPTCRGPLAPQHPPKPRPGPAWGRSCRRASFGQGLASGRDSEASRSRGAAGCAEARPDLRHGAPGSPPAAAAVLQGRRRTPSPAGGGLVALQAACG